MMSEMGWKEDSCGTVPRTVVRPASPDLRNKDHVKSRRPTCDSVMSTHLDGSAVTRGCTDSGAPQCCDRRECECRGWRP